jgi:hypothetical protein
MFSSYIYIEATSALRSFFCYIYIYLCISRTYHTNCHYFMLDLKKQFNCFYQKCLFFMFAKFHIGYHIGKAVVGSHEAT